MENSKEFTASLKSFCKINLFLKVISKRKDGFHNIFSYLIPISLYDEIIFEEIERGKFEVETFKADIKKEENLVFRAGMALKEYAKNKRGVKIKIIKNVPLGSGLGGGSSNCAIALNFLNKYWDCNLKKAYLIKIASKLGSDVPFFIDGMPAFVSGKGDKILKSKVKLKIPEKIVLFIPPFSIPTKKVYNVYDLMKKCKKRFKKSEFLSNLSFDLLENDLQEAAFEVEPKLKEMYKKIRETKPDFLILSGSGSAFWGFYKDKKREEEAKRLLTNFLKFYIVSFTNFLPLQGGIFYGYHASSGLPQRKR